MQYSFIILALTVFTNTAEAGVSCRVSCVRTYSEVLFREFQPKYTDQFDIACKNGGGIVRVGSSQTSGTGEYCGDSNWRYCIQPGKSDDYSTSVYKDSEYEARVAAIDECKAFLNKYYPISCSEHHSASHPTITEITCR